jgi:hypothetical protein
MQSTQQAAYIKKVLIPSEAPTSVIGIALCTPLRFDDLLIKHRFLLITPAITTEADSPTHWKLQVLPAHLLDLLR